MGPDNKSSNDEQYQYCLNNPLRYKLLEQTGEQGAQTPNYLQTDANCAAFALRRPSLTVALLRLDVVGNSFQECVLCQSASKVSLLSGLS